MRWYFEVLRKYADFEGRARRREYWVFMLVHSGIGTALYIGMIALGVAGGSANGLLMILWLYSLALAVPSLAVTVRRFHDTGRSGWWLLLGFVPVINLFLYVFLLQDTEKGPNDYGPDPKRLEFAPA